MSLSPAERDALLEKASQSISAGFSIPGGISRACACTSGCLRLDCSRAAYWYFRNLNPERFLRMLSAYTMLTGKLYHSPTPPTGRRESAQRRLDIAARQLAEYFRDGKPLVDCTPCMGASCDNLGCPIFWTMLFNVITPELLYRLQRMVAAVVDED